MFWQCAEGSEVVPPKAMKRATLQGWTQGVWLMVATVCNPPL